MCLRACVFVCVFVEMSEMGPKLRPDSEATSITRIGDLRSCSTIYIHVLSQLHTIRRSHVLHIYVRESEKPASFSFLVLMTAYAMSGLLMCDQRPCLSIG